MGKEYLEEKFECQECYYGCKGHKWNLDGNTTGNTSILYLDNVKVGLFLYDDLRALKKLLNKWDI